MHSVSRPFFGRDVGSSILASLSEAGGNNLHQPASKPLPPRPSISVGRHSECPRSFPQANERPRCGKLHFNNLFLLLELAMGQNTGRANRWPRRSQFGRSVPLRESSIVRRSHRAFLYGVQRLGAGQIRAVPSTHSPGKELSRDSTATHLSVCEPLFRFGDGDLRYDSNSRQIGRAHV